MPDCDGDGGPKPNDFVIGILVRFINTRTQAEEKKGEREILHNKWTELTPARESPREKERGIIELIKKKERDGVVMRPVRLADRFVVILKT